MKSTQEVGRNTRLSARVSPYTSFVLAPLPACFITEQSTVEAYLFVNYSNNEIANCYFMLMKFEMQHDDDSPTQVTTIILSG